MTASVRMTRLALLMLVAAPVFGQGASIGVKTGVPITDVVRTAGEIGTRPFRANPTRFTIGPVLDIRLPLGLGIEFGAMYKRFEQQAGQAQVFAEPGTPYRIEFSAYSATGRSWEFRFSANTAFRAGQFDPTWRRAWRSIT